MSHLLDDQELAAVIDILARRYSQPETALRHRNAFELLIATILSARTTDVQVNKLTRTLFAEFSRPEDFLKLLPAELEKHLRSVGLYRTKARYILATCHKLVEEFDGAVPETRTELLRLSGVGRKTANVVLANAFDFPAFAVDTHVFRVSNRLGIVSAGTVEETENQLTKRIPRQLWRDLHHRLIYHGRQVCHARAPECEQCDLAAYCRYIASG